MQPLKNEKIKDIQPTKIKKMSVFSKICLQFLNFIFLLRFVTSSRFYRHAGNGVQNSILFYFIQS
jgi:hypothetical protein